MEEPKCPTVQLAETTETLTKGHTEMAKSITRGIWGGTELFGMGETIGTMATIHDRQT